MLALQYCLWWLHRSRHRWRLDDLGVGSRNHCRNDSHAVDGCVQLCRCRRGRECRGNWLAVRLDRLNVRVVHRWCIRSARRMRSNGAANVVAARCVGPTRGLSWSLLLGWLNISSRGSVMRLAFGASLHLSSLVLR